MLSTLCEPGTEINLRETFAGLLGSGCAIGAGRDRVWVGWGASVASDRPAPSQLSLYAPDFFLKSAKPWIVYERSRCLPIPELIAGLAPFAEPSEGLGWTSSPFSELFHAFAGIQREIAVGTLVKAVPFIERRARAEFPRERRASVLLHALRRSQGQPLLTYGVWNDHEGLIGTTPETLFEERSRRSAPSSVSTMALAGTRTLDGGSLLDDPKETMEHRIVVEGIVERLAPLGRVAVGRTEELRLPTLAHLHTPIEAAPDRPIAFDEWVAALHPTPAIGAWPKAAGWRWLTEQPNAGRRGRYGAPFGFVPPDSDAGTCLVAIRNVQWSDGEARLLAGGGIVAASVVEREWREFNAKLDSVGEALGL